MKTIPIQLSTIVDGREWKLFTIRYTTPEADFEFYIHALSWDHANIILQDIRESGRVSGQVVGVRR
ncbi:hypothetical protein [Aeromonas molluscorum]|uniref:hypothetical protein n=1 Tax=Aeromonas molluscorum TaxID=271417 RepID=UPI003F1C9E00